MDVVCHSAVRCRTSLTAITVLLTAAVLSSCSPSAPPSTPASPPTPATKEYPRAELLVEPTALAEPGVAGKLVVLDCRPQKAFAESRLPGARWVDGAEWTNAFGSGTDSEAWSSRIGGLGIDRASRVVVYDGSCCNRAARVWWILQYWGVGDVRLLNGGWQGWKTAGLRIERDKPRAPTPKTFKAAPHAERLATKAQLLDALEDKSRQIVDARSEGEFRGIDKRTNKRAGHVPTARHLEWIDLIDKKTQRFKAADQLDALFRRAGVDLERPTTAYCQSGGRAAVVVFAMDLMGAGRASIYHASWGEWGNADDTPIVVEPPRSKKPPPAKSRKLLQTEPGVRETKIQPSFARAR